MLVNIQLIQLVAGLAILHFLETVNKISPERVKVGLKLPKF